jgi:spore coat protein CotF
VLILPLQLSQKEKLLLQDQQAHEEICIQKYTSYAQQATDPKLKQLFNSHAQQEQTHYDTVGQILQGQVPNMEQGQQQGGQGQQMGINLGMGLSQSHFGLSQGSNDDQALCQDMLMTEKHVSGSYDTTIFECQDANVRQALNHIQKEEQQHGEGIFNYMKQKGWYQPQ